MMWVVSSVSPGRSSHLLTVAFLILLRSYQIVQGHVEKSSSALIVVEEGGDEEATVGDEFSDEEDLEVFQPTDHWQTIKPGQAVPRGSHVRLNLQTGHREVRLGAEQMRGEEQRRDRPHEASQSYWSAEELKLKLKKMKDSSPRSGAAYQQDQNKFRSIEDLRKDLATLNLLVETDFQVIKRLLDQLNRTSSTEQRLQILLELEYLVHQVVAKTRLVQKLEVDNAQTLCSMGGLQLLLGGLNSSDFRLQDRSAFVLGSALASNPTVQVEAMERGGLQKLLTLLGTQRPLSVKKKALFALASLLRHFPFAQSHFLSHGGLQVLSEVFREDQGGSVRVRIVTLLYDLITEEELHSKVSTDESPDRLGPRSKGSLDPHSKGSPDQCSKGSLDQCSKGSLRAGLQEGRWCSLVPELLDSAEHDWREKGLQTMLAMVPVCLDQYRRHGSLPVSLGSLKAQYRDLVHQEQALGDDEGYFREILDLLHTLELKMK
ncbi:nucleotide exchange factor SIL1 isoform X1 [Gadus chalcogrammus]|uniref:nucleotide exchange factor SIL1 isoform X1 n=2 Tax=Gadus chalcogrammus TaxID=1042646 RepID=UPI0024C48A6D|nr:nucleotide exchange factor SIL1 isoform X1 [Gadus chalcogrammus]